MTFVIRAATAEDRAGIVAVVPRLRAFGPPPLRPSQALDDAERQALETALAAPTADSTLLVAESPGEGILGVVYVRTNTDYFTSERHGHLFIIMVSEDAEGRGVGRALMAAGEEWSRAQGHRFITLMVFAGNARAIRFYEAGGYVPDMIRYVKELTPPRG
jgi:GNAT superfamily N-acetyltransferase